MIWSEEPYHKGVNLIKTKDFDLKSTVVENAAIVLARRGCCLSIAVVHLLQSVGANPAVYEMEEKEMEHVACELKKADVVGGLGSDDGGAPQFQFPAVFIGGRWFGGLDQIIIAHITEELTPLLKQGGALWL